MKTRLLGALVGLAISFGLPIFAQEKEDVKPFPFTPILAGPQLVRQIEGRARRCPVLIVGSNVRRVLGSVEPVSATLRDAQEPIRHKRPPPLSRCARGSPPFIPFAS
jgi:hypothetical protein